MDWPSAGTGRPPLPLTRSDLRRRVLLGWGTVSTLPLGALPASWYRDTLAAPRRRTSNPTVRVAEVTP